jgi:hypothetical protein
MADIYFALLVITGITNLIFFILVLSSCRCPLAKMPKLGESKRYMRFFGGHCYYWYCFIASVILHIIFVLKVFGIALGLR